jgi:hypothetical protein
MNPKLIHSVYQRRHFLTNQQNPRIINEDQILLLTVSQASLQMPTSNLFHSLTHLIVFLVIVQL